MNGNDDRELTAVGRRLAGRRADAESAEADPPLRQTPRRLVWSWMVSDFVIGGIALPILAYLGWASEATSSGWR